MSPTIFRSAATRSSPMSAWASARSAHTSRRWARMPARFASHGLRAGAAVKVTKGIALTAEYTYRQSGSGKLNFGDEDVDYRLGNTKSSPFQVGMRFTP